MTAHVHDWRLHGKPKVAALGCHAGVTIAYRCAVCRRVKRVHLPDRAAAGWLR